MTVWVRQVLTAVIWNESQFTTSELRYPPNFTMCALLRFCRRPVARVGSGSPRALRLHPSTLPGPPKGYSAPFAPRNSIQPYPSSFDRAAGPQPSHRHPCAGILRLEAKNHRVSKHKWRLCRRNSTQSKFQLPPALSKGAFFRARPNAETWRCRRDQTLDSDRTERFWRASLPSSACHVPRYCGRRARKLFLEFLQLGRRMI